MSGFAVYYHITRLKDVTRIMSNRQRSCFALRKPMLQSWVDETLLVKQE